jgi:hypothetical protein
MIDGSNDSEDLTLDEWVALVNPQPGLDMTDNASDATGLAGGGSGMTYTGFSNGISPEDLSIRPGATLGTSAQPSLLSGSQGNEH